jgi:hypothetical protein
MICVMARVITTIASLRLVRTPKVTENSFTFGSRLRSVLSRAALSTAPGRADGLKPILTSALLEPGRAMDRTPEIVSYCFAFGSSII